MHIRIIKGVDTRGAGTRGPSSPLTQNSHHEIGIAKHFES